MPHTNPLCSGGRLPRGSCTQFVIFTQQGLGPDIISCVITLIYSPTSLLLQQCPPHHHQFKNLQYLILRVDVFAKYPHHHHQQQQQSNFVANPMVSGYCGKHLASLGTVARPRTCRHANSKHRSKELNNSAGQGSRHFSTTEKIEREMVTCSVVQYFLLSVTTDSQKYLSSFYMYLDG